MRVFHVVFDEPIGPTWIAYVDRPELKPNAKELRINSWVEEVELDDLCTRFKDHVIKTREIQGNEPMHCTLEVRKV